MAKKRAGEGSNLGLIITLVFFVLSTVILGVTTYMGFSEQEKLVKEKQDAEKKFSEMEKFRNWDRTQARIYRVYIGRPMVQGPDAMDLAKEVQGMLAGQYPAGADQKSKDDVGKLLKDFEPTMPWAANTDSPASNFEKRLGELDNRITSLQAAVAREKANVAKVEADKKDMEEQKDKQIAAINKAMKDLRTTLEADLKRDYYAKAMEEVRTKLVAEGKQMTTLRVDLDAEKKVRADLEKKLAALQKKYDTDQRALRVANKDLDETRTILSALAEKHNEDVRTLKDTTRDTVASTKLRTWDKDWKVVDIDRKGKMPYINLGTADGLVPQVTFSVHAPTGAGGRRMQEAAKANLEVIRVIGPHLSQARLTSIRDEKRDPVLKGDLLFNASWDPTRRKQVAVAGIVDLGLDGADNTDDFRRLLGRQRVDLVAWVDSKDEKPAIKTVGEGLSKDTEYMILADRMRGSKHPKSRNDEYTKAYDQKRDELIEKAKTAGITVISINKYLELIGYRHPKLNATPGSGY